MLTSTRTRADDVRALVGAIALGSSAGLVIGAVFLAGSGARPAPRPVPAPAGPLQAQAFPAAHAGSSSVRGSLPANAAALGPQAVMGSPGEVLRDRFRVAARPFRFQQVADAPTDLHCLTEAVYFEARGEAPAGQQAVAQVVLNRVRHPAFPKTICAVVHQHTGYGCQFSFACGDHRAELTSVAWRRAESIAAREMHGAVMTAVGDATAFQAARASPFAGLLKVAQVGAHVFYRFGGQAGAPAMFHQTPDASGGPAKIELARLETSAAARPVAAIPPDTRPKAAAPVVTPAPAHLSLPPAPLETAALPSKSTPAIIDHMPAEPTLAASPAGRPAGTPATRPPAVTVALAQS